MVAYALFHRVTDINEVFDAAKIKQLLKQQAPHGDRVREIAKKGKKCAGISLEEAAELLAIDDISLWEAIFEAAAHVKNNIYGERLVFFAPLYISSYCMNDCDYCAFHVRNRSPRVKLSLEEVKKQVEHLVDMGHKRLLLEFGEHPLNTIDYITEVIKTIYDVKRKNGEIRRVNVNIAATSVDDYKKLKEVGIGTYQLFQETYHEESYKQYHKGPKADFERQLFAHDRAFAGGLDDVGIGALFGLYDYRFETLALISHADYLERTYGTGPHTISVPRFQPAESVTMPDTHAVSEEQLLRIIAVLRLAVPYTGMIISTRERAETREKAFKIGISQTSAGSETAPGGYGKEKESALKQFQTADHRSLDAVVLDILSKGLLPSFCTACYREGRTGEDFMHIAKPGEIHNLCRPNALLTFQEYLEDYASPEVVALGEEIVLKYLDQIAHPVRRKATIRRLEQIRQGKRDIYF